MDSRSKEDAYGSRSLIASIILQAIDDLFIPKNGHDPKIKEYPLYLVSDYGKPELEGIASGIYIYRENNHIHSITIHLDSNKKSEYTDLGDMKEKRLPQSKQFPKNHKDGSRRCKEIVYDQYLMSCVMRGIKKTKPNEANLRLRNNAKAFINPQNKMFGFYCTLISLDPVALSQAIYRSKRNGTLKDLRKRFMASMNGKTIKEPKDGAMEAQ
jgi:hypothetical protein